jgi:hypothetical protein
MRKCSSPYSKATASQHYDSNTCCVCSCALVVAPLQRCHCMQPTSLLDCCSLCCRLIAMPLLRSRLALEAMLALTIMPAVAGAAVDCCKCMCIRWCPVSAPGLQSSNKQLLLLLPGLCCCSTACHARPLTCLKLT